MRRLHEIKDKNKIVRKERCPSITPIFNFISPIFPRGFYFFYPEGTLWGKTFPKKNYIYIYIYIYIYKDFNQHIKFREL